MIVLKILFPLISSIAMISCIREMRKLPREELSPKQNFRRMDLAMFGWGIVDIVLAILIGVFVEKVVWYEIGVKEDIMCVGWLLVWGIPYLISAFQVKKRVKLYWDTVEHDLPELLVYKATSGLIVNAFVSVFVFKGLFILFEVVWLLNR